MVIQRARLLGLRLLQLVRLLVGLLQVASLLEVGHEFGQVRQLQGSLLLQVRCWHLFA